MIFIAYFWRDENNFETRFVKFSNVPLKVTITLSTV